MMQSSGGNVEWGKGHRAVQVAWSSGGNVERWRERGAVEWTQSGGGNVSDLNRSQTRLRCIFTLFT